MSLLMLVVDCIRLEQQALCKVAEGLVLGVKADMEVQVVFEVSEVEVVELEAKVACYQQRKTCP